MPDPKPEVLTFGFRFRRSQAPRLRALADHVRRQEIQADVSVFEQAAESAERGEPLEVKCATELDMRLVAQGYVNWGVPPIAIDLLNG